jgi:hypothetical protein
VSLTFTVPRETLIERRFCSGENPQTYVQLHPNGDMSKCVDLSGDIRQDGQAVQVIPPVNFGR